MSIEGLTTVLTDAFESAMRGDTLDKLELDKAYLALEGEDIPDEKRFIDCPMKKLETGWQFVSANEEINLPEQITKLSLRSGSNVAIIVWKKEFFAIQKIRLGIMKSLGLPITGNFAIRFTDVIFGKGFMEDLDELKKGMGGI